VLVNGNGSFNAAHDLNRTSTFVPTSLAEGSTIEGYVSGFLTTNQPS
jgi:hypothetical protein